MTADPGLPAHIEATTRTTVIWVCHHCRSRLTPGIYANPNYGAQVLADWIEYHRHGVTEEHDTNPTETRP